MKKVNEKYTNLLLCVAMLVMLGAALVPIFAGNTPWSRYVFAAGAVLTLIAQVLMPAPDSTLRVRRLARINVWAAVLYCVAAACLFINDAAMQRSWIAFLLAGAVIQIYATLMLAKLTKKA